MSKHRQHRTKLGAKGIDPIWSQACSSLLHFLGGNFQNPSLDLHKPSLQAAECLVIGSACSTAYPQACPLSRPTPLPWTHRELASNPALVLCTPQVSQAAADLLAYCEAHVREDPLIIPVPASENPIREKKFFCTIL